MKKSRKVVGTEGDVLRTWREEKRLSVSQVAKTIGVSASYIYGIENGSQYPPYGDVLFNILELYEKKVKSENQRLEKLKLTSRILKTLDDNKLSFILGKLEELDRQELTS